MIYTGRIVSKTAALGSVRRGLAPALRSVVLTVTHGPWDGEKLRGLPSSLPWYRGLSAYLPHGTTANPPYPFGCGGVAQRQRGRSVARPERRQQALRTAILGPALPHLATDSAHQKYASWEEDERLRALLAADHVVRVLAPMALEQDFRAQAAFLRALPSLIAVDRGEVATDIPPEILMTQLFGLRETEVGAAFEASGWPRIFVALNNAGRDVDLLARAMPIDAESPQDQRQRQAYQRRCRAQSAVLALALLAVASCIPQELLPHGTLPLLRALGVPGAGEELVRRMRDALDRCVAGGPGEVPSVDLQPPMDSLHTAQFMMVAVHHAATATRSVRPWISVRAALLRMACVHDRCWIHPDCCENEALGRACFETEVRPWIAGS